MYETETINNLFKGPIDELNDFVNEIREEGYSCKFYEDPRENDKNVGCVNIYKVNSMGYSKFEEIVVKYPNLKVCTWVVNYNYDELSVVYSESGDAFLATITGGIYFDGKDEDLFAFRKNQYPIFEYDAVETDTRTGENIYYDYTFDFEKMWYDGKFVD